MLEWISRDCETSNEINDYSNWKKTTKPTDETRLKIEIAILQTNPRFIRVSEFQYRLFWPRWTQIIKRDVDLIACKCDRESYVQAFLSPSLFLVEYFMAEKHKNALILNIADHRAVKTVDIYFLPSLPRRHTRNRVELANRTRVYRTETEKSSGICIHYEVRCKRQQDKSEGG